MSLPKRLLHPGTRAPGQKYTEENNIMDLFQKCIDYTVADEAKAAGVYIYFHALESRQDTEVIMEGKRRIMLGSNNYLGLTAAPEVVAAAEAALAEYGTGCSGS